MPKDNRERLRLDALVQLLDHKSHRIEAIRELVGGVTATELRTVERVPDDVLDALLDGLGDPKATVRWWCIQLLDHVPDERALLAVVDMLDDPVPRVRRNAVHALGCVTCKPTADLELPAAVVDRITQMAANDPNEKVRREAAYTLACRATVVQ